MLGAVAAAGRARGGQAVRPYGDDERCTSWRLLEWTSSRQVADDVAELFRYGGEPAPEVAALLHRLAQMNDDIAHGRPRASYWLG